MEQQIITFNSSQANEAENKVHLVFSIIFLSTHINMCDLQAILGDSITHLFCGKVVLEVHICWYFILT